MFRRALAAASTSALLFLTSAALAQAEPPVDDPPEQLTVGKGGTFQPGLLIQAWAQGSRQSGKTTSGLRLRRTELKVKGDIVSELLSYQVMFDLAKVLEFDDTEQPVEGQSPEPTEPGSVAVAQPASNVSVLQDAYFTFRSEYADVSVGQFKNTLSWEGYNSASKLILPERALVSRHYGDARDIGIKIDKELGDHFYYFAGVFNGAGLNRRDDDNQKDLSLRVEAYPMKGVMLGAVGYAGVGQRSRAETKDRVEADLLIQLSKARLQVEYLHGWDGPTSAARVEGHGFYAALAYRVFDVLEPVVRVGTLDTDISRDVAAGKLDEVWHYEASLTYYLLRDHHAKFALAYGFFDYDDSDARGEVIAMGQVAY